MDARRARQLAVFVRWTLLLAAWLMVWSMWFRQTASPPTSDGASSGTTPASASTSPPVTPRTGAPLLLAPGHVCGSARASTQRESSTVGTAFFALMAVFMLPAFGALVGWLLVLVASLLLRSVCLAASLFLELCCPHSV